MESSDNSSQLLLNNKNSNHKTIVNELLGTANYFVCMVAFAKNSGFCSIKDLLKDRLSKGLRAVFVVGVDFYQSDPNVMHEIQRMKSYGDITLYIGDPKRNKTFHPKLFLFVQDNIEKLIVGSANLTRGGLDENHEISILHIDAHNSFSNDIDKWIQELHDSGEILEANNAIIDEYSMRHAIYTPQMRIAQKRAEKAADSPLGGRETLSRILEEMKADDSEDGFYSSVKSREKHRKRGVLLLKEFGANPRVTHDVFLELYSRLVETMHSGGLQRSKTKILPSSANFRKGIRELLEMESRDPVVLFDHLRNRFKKVNGAGTNLITEILHLVDNKIFAVMNRNSVSGIGLAGMGNFPSRPNKTNVDGELYAEFCRSAVEVQESLRLNNLSELDSLFNYAYWRD